MSEKTAVVTGASRGIGAACAKTLARDGFKVVINYNKSEAEAISLRDNIAFLGGNAEIFRADIRKPDEVSDLFCFARQKFGNVTVLVNNAGVSLIKLIQDTSEEEWNDLFSVNCGGTFRCVKHVIPQMLSAGGGSIINISSVWGRVGASCEAAYSASKASVIGFTKALAKELGPSGIRVNCIAPGVIDTEMNSMHSSDVMESLAEETPLGRIGSPEDIAEAAAFLASDKACFINGQILGVDGGFCL